MVSKWGLSSFTYLNQPFFFGLISSLITSFFLPNNPFFGTFKFSSRVLDFLLNRPFLGSFFIYWNITTFSNRRFLLFKDSEYILIFNL